MSDTDSRRWLHEAVICRLTAPMLAQDEESLCKQLVTYGFTMILIDADVLTPALVTAANRHNIRVLHNLSLDSTSLADSLNGRLQSLAAGDDVTATDVWLAHESSFGNSTVSQLNLTGSDLSSSGAIALMMQMSLPYTPVVELGRMLQSIPRDQAELLRSVIFWRSRNRVAAATPRLVHAAENGSLLYILDSWLVVLNWNREEISIDIGSRGSMWLMLATHRDVHLHGSLLELPAQSGAILANELAR